MPEETATPTKVLVATQHFVCELDGRDFFVHAGDQLPSDHPAVQGRLELFREKTDTD